MVVQALALSLVLQLGSCGVFAQSPSTVRATLPTVAIEAPAEALGAAPEVATLSPTMSRYRDPLQGVSSSDFVRRALASNGELAAARLDIERARARLRQAGLRPNPTLDFEQTSERLTGAGTDRATGIGVSLPLELGGKRGRRVELAQAELEAVEAEIADRDRRLAGQVATLYAEALGSLRELEITEGINKIDLEMARFVQVRVNEGDTAPLELNHLRVEVDRLRSRRALVEGRLQSALIRLKSIAGIPPTEPLRLREDLSTPVLSLPPVMQEAAIEIALRTRPDLRFARLEEEVAQAGLRLARAQSVPNAIVFSRSVFDRTITDLPAPLVPVPNRSRRLAFGISIGLPVFNKNQGAKAEAATAISQARTRREFLEQVVRAEVASAYTRYEAARAALNTFEQGVIERSNDNIRVIRAAYEAGAYRITDLLTEQRRLVDSQREFTEALTERYRALVDFNVALGTAAAPTGENSKP